MPRVLVVGGVHAGFYAAWQPEKRLRLGEAEGVVDDPRPSTTCQPFLPEVTAASVDARHAAVSRPRHRRRRLFGRDIVSLQSVQHPRNALVSGGVSRDHR